MNAMQNASNDAQNKINRQLIDYNATQNDLIFKTRKRLFKLENNFRLLIAGISIIIITTGLMGLVVSYG
jgi:translation initiation factor 2B subunit (eIF-2B alpha/beta/delta family)